MSELQSYYDNFKTGYWASENAEECLCHGGGFALSEVDTWHKCPFHYVGQLSPEDLDLMHDASEEVIAAAEAHSKAVWAVGQAKKKVEYAESNLVAATAAMKAAEAALAKAMGTPEKAEEPKAAEVADDDAGSDEDIPF